MSPHAIGVLADQANVDSILFFPTSSWDRRIAADLISETEIHLADKVSTLPQMRRILAVKGYQALRKRFMSEIKGMTGLQGFRTMVLAMRSFALERPGLSAATWLALAAEWQRVGWSESDTHHVSSGDGFREELNPSYALAR